MQENTNKQGSAPSRNIINPRNIIVCFAFVTLLVVAFYWINARQYVSTDDAYIDAHVVRIAPQIAGVIDALMVTPNQRVEENDVLIKISPDTILPLIENQKAIVNQARAAQGQAQAEESRAVAAKQRADIATQTAAVILTQAEQDLARLISLQERNAEAVATINVDNAKTTLASARTAYDGAKSDVLAAQAQVDAARSAVQAALASTQGADAQADSAGLNLDETTIVAPISGSIANITINRGSYVSPGTQMMALVPDDVWVTANFKETDLTKIKLGASVEIEIDAYSGRTFAGVVDSIQRAAGQEFQLLPAQNATGNFVKVVQRVPVRIVFSEPLPKDLVIGPGMSVIPTVKVEQ